MTANPPPEEKKPNSSYYGCDSTRRRRTVFSKSQLNILKDFFEINPYPGIEEREELSRLTNIPESRIHVWFQNRRARQHAQQKKRPSEATADSRKRMRLENVSSGPILEENFSEPEPPMPNASRHHSWAGKQEASPRSVPSTTEAAGLYGDVTSPNHPFFFMRPSTELQPCTFPRPMSQGSSSQWSSSWALQGTQGPETYKTHTSFGGVKSPLCIQEQGCTVEQAYSKAFQCAQEPPNQLQQPHPQEKGLQQPHLHQLCPEQSYPYQPHPNQSSVLQTLVPQTPTFQVQQLTSSQHQSQELQHQTLPPSLVLGEEQSYELFPAFNQQELHPFDLSKRTVGLGSRCPNGYLTAPQVPCAPQGHLPAPENLASLQGHLPASQRHLADPHGHLDEPRDNLDDILQDLDEISGTTSKNCKFLHV